MLFYFPLVLSVFLVIVTYFTGRFSPNSSFNYNLPLKYLIKSEKIKKYFFYPSCGLTKHFVILHFAMLIGLGFNIILYILHWANGSTTSILNSDLYIKIYSMIVMTIIMIVFIINISIHSKYTFKK